MSKDFFAQQLLEEFDDKPTLAGLQQALLASRAVGFDYVDDNEALEHFNSEVAEIAEAFQENDKDHLASELGDANFLLIEIARRRGIDFDQTMRNHGKKFLRRLAFIEAELKKRGQTWDDVSWPNEMKDLWDQAKKTGL